MAGRCSPALPECFKQYTLARLINFPAHYQHFRLRRKPHCVRPSVFCKQNTMINLSVQSFGLPRANTQFAPTLKGSAEYSIWGQSRLRRTVPVFPQLYRMSARASRLSEPKAQEAKSSHCNDSFVRY